MNRALVVALLVLAPLAACEREKREFKKPQTAASVERNAFAVAQGKRLFRWFNCNTCHAPGGGGDWGPALSDDRWRYGSAPQAIYASIVEGRPNGMPAFGGHIAPDQVWQIVAYVRSLSGQLRKDVAPGRGDELQAAPGEATRDEEKPKPERRP